MVNSTKKKIIIFCQAPADIPYVLTIYEKYKQNKIISIYVINVHNMFKFLNSLNLDIEQLVFIPYKLKSFKRITQIFKEKIRIKKLKKEYFDLITNNDIYFFSRFEDWLTASFLNELKTKNSIYYVDHYDFSSDYFKKKIFNLKLFGLKAIYYFITNVNFKVNILEKLPEFNIEKLKIKKIIPELNHQVFTKYSYKIDTSEVKNPIALLFISPSENMIFDENSYDDIQLKIFKSLKKNNWSIIVKGHPRIGIPENIINLIDIEIPIFIPAEFVQIEKISICLGVITSALAHYVNNTKTYSLINLYEFKDLNSKSIFKDYLSKLSTNKINFFKNYDDFENIITKKLHY